MASEQQRITFQPHALIIYPALQALYDDAKKPDAHECATVNLIEGIFNKVILNSNHVYHIFSQNPLKPKDMKRADDVIMYLQAIGGMAILCVIECKRTNKVTDTSINELHNQLLRYCQMAVEHSQTEFVYAMSAVGTRFMLWKHYTNSGDLSNFWSTDSGTGMSMFESYKDVGNAIEAEEFRQGIDWMMRFPPSIAYGQSTSTEDYGSEHTPLPGQMAAAAEEEEDDTPILPYCDKETGEFKFNFIPREKLEWDGKTFFWQSKDGIKQRLPTDLLVLENGALGYYNGRDYTAYDQPGKGKGKKRA
jgi:hypothetical protein